VRYRKEIEGISGKSPVTAGKANKLPRLVGSVSFQEDVTLLAYFLENMELDLQLSYGTFKPTWREVVSYVKDWRLSPFEIIKFMEIEQNRLAFKNKLPRVEKSDKSFFREHLCLQNDLDDVLMPAIKVALCGNNLPNALISDLQMAVKEFSTLLPISVSEKYAGVYEQTSAYCEDVGLSFAEFVISLQLPLVNWTYFIIDGVAVFPHRREGVLLVFFLAYKDKYVIMKEEQFRSLYSANYLESIEFSLVSGVSSEVELPVLAAGVKGLDSYPLHYLFWGRKPIVSGKEKDISG
jgi:hypothetical protein